MCNYCHFSERRQHSNLVKYWVGICQCLRARTQWSTNLEQADEGTAKVWLAHGTTCFSFCSRALAIFYTFLEHSLLRTILCSKINTQSIIQGFCFYLEDKAKKLTSWLQDTHSSGVVNGSCRNLASLKSQALTVKKNVLLADPDQQASLRLGLRKEPSLFWLHANRKQTILGFPGSCPNPVCQKCTWFCFLFYSVRGEGIVEIVKWDSYLNKMRIVLLESTVQDSETARTKKSFLCLNLHSYLQESKTAATEWKWQYSTVPYVPRGKTVWTLGCTYCHFVDQNLLFCEGLRMRAHHFSQKFQHLWCLVIKHIPHPEPITSKLCLI